MGRLLGPVKFEDGENLDAVGADRLLCLLGCVLVVANLAFEVDVLALLERGGKLGELAEDDAAVPLGDLLVLAALFVLVAFRCG